MEAQDSPDRTAELTQLCQSCGFCCDGTLSGGARLQPDELEPARRKGLNVVKDKGFTLPCTRLENKCCTIYEERPSVCQAFMCKLLVRHRDEGGPVERRIRVVNKVRSLLEQLQQYGFKRQPNGDITFSAEGDDAPLAMEAFSMLRMHLEEDFSRVFAPEAKPPEPPA